MDVQWLVMTKLLKVADHIYKDVTEKKQARAEAGVRAATRAARGAELRQRDPW